MKIVEYLSIHEKKKKKNARKNFLSNKSGKKENNRQVFLFKLLANIRHYFTTWKRLKITDLICGAIFFSRPMDLHLRIKSSIA